MRRVPSQALVTGQVANVMGFNIIVLTQLSAGTNDPKMTSKVLLFPKTALVWLLLKTLQLKQTTYPRNLLH